MSIADPALRNRGSAKSCNEVPLSLTSYDCIMLVDKQTTTLDVELNCSKSIIEYKSMTL